MLSYRVKWLWGYRGVRCSNESSTRLLNIMHTHRIVYNRLNREDNGDLSFEISEKEYKMLLPILDKNGIKVYSVYGRGLPFIYKAHRNRAGLIIGLVLYMSLIFLSSFFIWDIRVVSTTETPHNVIIENFKKLGCYEGTFLPSVDFEDLCIDYLEEYKDFSWVSVNVRGTVAYVEIREKTVYDRSADNPRNLVASHGGVIESYSVYKGRSLVKEGSVVKKGDLLISGIVDNKEGAFRLCHADGRVVAVIDTDISVDVPYVNEKKVYTGRKFAKQKICFFNLNIPYFSDNIPEDVTCTQTAEKDRAVLFDRIELPLSIDRNVYYEYRTEQYTYTQAEAQQAAQMLMRQRFESELGDVELISVNTSGEHSDKGYTLTCRIKCRMDITTPVDIET